MNIEEQLRQQYSTLPFSDNFMFTHVMENLNIARKVIKIILQEEIPDIDNSDTEQRRLCINFVIMTLTIVFLWVMKHTRLF